MKNVLLFLLLTLLSAPAFAQEGCGTDATSEVLEWWQKRAFSLQANTRAKTTQAFTVPVHIHIVGYDNGSNFFPQDKAYELVCELNERFAPLQISFFLDSAVSCISNSFYANPTGPYINQMMGLYNRPLACNIYIVPALTGLCGLTYFPNQGPAQGRGGIVLKASCAGPGNTDPAHEMGHYFSLLHTFQGAGGTSPELVNGSNCTTAGDFFCDTRADWQDFRWNCPYAGTKQDANGDFYKPDSSLYMGYSNVPCPSRFSAQQQAAIVYSRANDRPYLDSIAAPVFPQLTPVALVNPANGDTSVFINAVGFKWQKVAGATAYNLRVSDTMDKTFQSPVLNIITPDTFLNSNPAFVAGRRYHWEVLSLNSIETCILPNAPNLQRFQFSGTQTSSVGSFSSEAFSLSISPNPVTANQSFQLYLKSALPADLQLEIVTLTGISVWKQESKIPAGKTTLQIPSQEWPAGVYLLRATAPGFSEVCRLLKMN